MRNVILTAVMVLTTLVSSGADARIKGRVDVGAVGVAIEQLTNGLGTDTLWLGGVRTDATIVPFDCTGFCLKPMFTYARGNGEYITGGLGVGHYTPINDCWSVVPYVGVSFTTLHANIKSVQTVPTPAAIEDIDSKSFYVGGDIIYNINDCFSITGSAQYAWARSRTHIKNLPQGFPGGLTEISEKGVTSGPILAVILDYYFCDCWAVSAAFGWNSSLDEERLGMRGYGIKLGLGRMF